MDTSIIVALISLAAVFLGAVATAVVDLIRSKKQGTLLNKNIEIVDKNVDEEAEKIKEKVRDVKEDTSYIKNTVSKNEEAFSKLASQIDNINADVEYKKRLTSEASISVNNKEFFMSGIEKLYAENANLSSQNRKLREENEILKQTILNLQEENYTYKIKENKRNNNYEYDR